MARRPVGKGTGFDMARLGGTLDDASVSLARKLREDLSPNERGAMRAEDWSFRCGFLLGKFGACYPVDKLYDAAYAWRLFGSEADEQRPST